jgi:lipoate-protein ligase A
MVGTAGEEQREIRGVLESGLTVPKVLCWHYALPAIVLGRGQKPSTELFERARGEGVEVVSRTSGGGAVIAGPWMLSLTLAVPRTHALARSSLPSGYRAVGGACRGVLARLGVPTDVVDVRPAVGATESRVPSEVDWACFAGLSHGELVAAGERKVVGLSQVRRRNVVAFCVGVLLERPDWELLLRVWLGRADPQWVSELEHRTVDCARLAADGRRPSAGSLAAALEAELPGLDLAA